MDQSFPLGELHNLCSPPLHPSLPLETTAQLSHPEKLAPPQRNQSMAQTLDKASPSYRGYLAIIKLRGASASVSEWRYSQKSPCRLNPPLPLPLHPPPQTLDQTIEEISELDRTRPDSLTLLDLSLSSSSSVNSIGLCLPPGTPQRQRPS